MEEQSSSNEKEKQATSCTERSSLRITDRRDSAATSLSSRAFSPVAFFHDGLLINPSDLQKNLMGAQRRAQAIATAPRRKRYDDDKEEDETKKTLLGYTRTSALPIPIVYEGQHPHSLPQIQSDSTLLPTFRVDPPNQDYVGSLDYPLPHDTPLNRYRSVPLPNRNDAWKD